MWEIVSAVIGAIVKVLFGRWFGTPQDPQVEALNEELDAKNREAAALAAPARDKSAIVLSLREHEPKP